MGQISLKEQRPTAPSTLNLITKEIRPRGCRQRRGLISLEIGFKMPAAAGRWAPLLFQWELPLINNPFVYRLN